MMSLYPKTFQNRSSRAFFGFSRNRTKAGSCRSGGALSRYFARLHLFRRPAWSAADVEQCRVYRRSRRVGVLFILFPLRLQMLALAVTAGLIALPQMLYLTGGSGRIPMPRLIHWGYMVEQPTAANVLKYLGFTFGFKWLLIALALVFANSLQRRLFLAVSSLIAVAFCFQFTIEVLANQKFLHTWAIVADLFVAFGLWRLWRLSLAGTTVPGNSLRPFCFC